MNKLNEMNIAKLSEQEVSKILDFEKDLNQRHGNDELYVLVLKK